MGKFSTIANLAMVGAGIFIFLKVFPLVQGFFTGAPPLPAAAPAQAPTIPLGTLPPVGAFAQQALAPPLPEPKPYKYGKEDWEYAFGLVEMLDPIMPGMAKGIAEQTFENILAQLPNGAPPSSAAPSVVQPPALWHIPPDIYPPGTFFLSQADILPATPAPAPIVQELTGWAAGRVVGSGVTGGQAWERIASGIDRETTTRWL